MRWHASSWARSLLLLPLLASLGCAYPRRGTPLSEVRSDLSSIEAPPGVIELRFLSAVVPPQKRGGMAWDEDGSAPDVSVRVYRDDHLVWQSTPVERGLSPELNVTPAENLYLPPDASVRIELWDVDSVAGDPIGVWQGRGLPSGALLGANARVMLDSRAVLVMRVERARPQRGLGLALYEVRSDRLLAVTVLPRSPASRAGLLEGDSIVAIGEDAIETIGSSRAASALARAGTERGATLTVLRGTTRQILRLDGGYVWQVL
ncbi:MAG: PDZ domain-containing protein [Myxococcales bacterium]|nr:PDZ domain-containing protein [Myxococcales bacterium]